MACVSVKSHLKFKDLLHDVEVSGRALKLEIRLEFVKKVPLTHKSHFKNSSFGK